MIDLLAISLISVVAASTYLAFRYISFGARRSIDNLQSSIAKIGELSDPRLSLMIRQIWSDRFLQFRSNRKNGNDGSIELWIPKNGWFDTQHPWIIKRCIEQDLPCTEFIDGAGNTYSVVLFGDDSNKAAVFARDFLIDIFGMKCKDKVSVRIDIHSGIKNRGQG